MTITITIRPNEKDKQHIQNIRSHLKDIKTNTSAKRVALKMLSDQIDTIRADKNKSRPE
jgi:hypothetical protein